MNQKRARILVVDDDESIVFLLSKALERQGYTVETASDGQEGWQKIKNSPPFAVLLTDLMMPKMDGMELIRRAREMDPYLEIIVITAAASIKSAVVAMRDGNAYDYLMKPFESMQQLVMVIERALSHRRLVLERVTLQQQAQTDATRLHALVSSVGEAILAASGDGVITVANPAACRLFGKEELVGEVFHEWLPAKFAGLIDAWDEVLERAATSVEVRWQENFVFWVNITPLPDYTGQKSWVMVIRDITSMREVESLRTQAISEVINKIRLPMAEAMNAVVDINLRAADDERIGSSLFRLTKVWERIQGIGDELVNIVQDKAERKIRMEHMGPGGVIEGLQTERLMQVYRRAGGRFSTEVAEGVSALYTDPELFNRLMQGLLRRAVRRSSPGGGILVRVREFQEKIWIEIKDDGPPLSELGLSRIFEKSPAEISTDSLDVTLELARAKAILNRLDGQLWVGRIGETKSKTVVCLPVANQ